MNPFTLIHNKYPLPPLVWYMIVETGLARSAFFMAMPFIALRMHGTSTTSMPLIGAVIGFGPLVATLMGFYAAHLSDLWGRRLIVIASMMLWALVFLGLSYADTPLAFGILMGLNGLARGTFEPVASALISDLCHRKDPSGQLQKGAFHLRYYAINVGAAVGPLIGASLVVTSPGLGFRITSLVYFLGAVIFMILSKKWGLAEMEKARERTSHAFTDVLKALFTDRSLQLYLVAYFCICFALSQIDTNLAIYLKELYGAEGVSLFGRVLAWNGLLVVCFTIPVLAWTKRFDLNVSCAVSALIWAIGYFTYAFAHTPFQFLTAMTIFSFGEIVVFANGYLIIESLAPRHMRGAYLGTMNLAHAGFVVGPMAGGFLYQTGSGLLLFVVMGILLLVSGTMYLIARPKPALA